MQPRQEISAWRPRVPGVVEVFHAHFTEHAYPMHVHDAWTYHSRPVRPHRARLARRAGPALLELSPSPTAPSVRAL